METLILLLLSILPPLILIFYINFLDKQRPEPKKYIIKAFNWGIFSCMLTFCFTFIFSMFGQSNDDGTIPDILYSSFVEAAIPEEIAKFLCLIIALRKNKFFDEHMDGIVYACCVGMGFACFENLLYVMQDEQGLAVGLLRAFTAIPGHFMFAVLMGYFYSLYYFDGKGFFNVLFVPIMAHGIYDSICFAADSFGAIVPLLLIVFIIILLVKSKKMINSHLDTDKNNNNNNNNIL